MMFYTHLAFSFLIGLLATSLLNIKQKILFIFLVCLFGILPDIDSYKSKIGKKIPIISFIINIIFKHRGVFHSIFIPILLFFAFAFLGYYYIGLAILLGYLSHVFLDTLTPSGIRLLWPFGFRIKGFIKTNSFLEKILFLFLCIVDIYIIVFY